MALQPKKMPVSNSLKVLKKTGLIFIRPICL